MKNFKGMTALILVLLMVLSFAGCHKKNEIAVTIGDVEFTSAYYMCALINADSEAKSKVQEALSEKEGEEESTDTSTQEDIDYYAEKIDDKDFVTWVEDKAMDTLKEIAAYKTLCKEAKVEPKEEDIQNAEYYASMYWSSYGYSAYFEPNGVGQATYTSYMTDSYYAESYFEHLYGEDGEKAIASDEVLEKMYNNFLIADVLDATFTSEDTDDTKAALKTKLEGYVTDLKDGKKTFEQVYNEYNGITEETETEETTEETTEESDEPQPKDELATILGAKDTAYESDQYDTVKEMKVGDIKLIELEDQSGYKLVIKQDIKADEYYADNLDMITRHLIADEEYKDYIADYAKKLNTDVNNYAVKQFKVKNIIEPSYE